MAKKNKEVLFSRVSTEAKKYAFEAAKRYKVPAGEVVERLLLANKRKYEKRTAEEKTAA
jgi:hypothetical protein